MKGKGYFLVDSGGSSNSIVSYIISITDVNFVEFDLYFESMINSLKVSPPDFDINFPWEDRNDVSAMFLNV